MLTQEEWDSLTPEEQGQKEAEKPVTPTPGVDDDIVIIGGKPRPLQNFVSEIVRKTKEEVIREVGNRQLEQIPPPRPAQSSEDYMGNVLKQAEDEMSRTGRSVPLETILGLIAQGSQYHIRNTVTSMRQAAKTVQETVKSLKGKYRDYKEYEDEFRDAVDNINSDLVSQQGLEMLFNSIRGAKLDDKLAKIEEANRKRAEKDEKIVGPSSGSGTGAGGSKPTLNENQKKEFISMGLDTEDEYTGLLQKRQARAKAEGWKVIPQTLSETAQRG